MALPASVTPITVTGKIFRSEPEEPIEGVIITFTPKVPGPHRVPADNTLLLLTPEVATTDVDGEISFVMPGSNDPDLLPGSLWDVAFTGALTKSYTDVLIPHNAPGGTIDLTDILPGGASSIGQAYKLVSLTDVDLDPPPSDGDALVYDSATQTWQPGPGGSGANELSDLTDVDTATTPPTDGQALVWVDADNVWEPGDVASTWDDISGKPTEFTPAAHSHTAPAWTDITGKPTTFAPILPIGIDNVTDLQPELDGKSDVGHTHTIANVADLQDDLDGKQVLTNAVLVARGSGGTWPARPSVEHVTWVERNFESPLVPAGMLDGDLYEGPDGLSGFTP